MFNKYLVSLYSFSSVSGVLGSLKVLAAFVSLLGNLKKSQMKCFESSAYLLWFET